MKKNLALLLFLLFLLLAWFSWKWYKDAVVCCENAVPTVQYGPLIFDCETGDVITNELWPDKKSEIVAFQSSEKKLLLVGPYFTSETEVDGIEKAEKVKALFVEISSDDIITSARKAGDCESTKVNMLHELHYKWITDNADVIERLDKTIVFYKYDSDEEISNEQVLRYFDELASFLKVSGDKIMITGYTDSDGTEEYNLDLGLSRANEHKEHLVKLGVAENKISVQTKGEALPLALNDTPENKQMNRRVEIHIIE